MTTHHRQFHTFGMRSLQAAAGLAMLAGLLVGGCSDEAEGGDANGNVPAKCQEGTGGLGIDHTADLQVSRGDQAVQDGAAVSVPTGSLDLGKTLDIEFLVINGAGKVVGRELKITEAVVEYSPLTGEDAAKSPFECLARAGTALVPCKGHDFGSIMPTGLDPACATATPVESANIVVRFKKPADNLVRMAKLVLRTSGDNKFKDKPFTVSLQTVAGTPKIKVTPEFIDFETVKVGEPKEKKLTIVNIGDANLEISQIDLALTDGQAFRMAIAGKEYKGGLAAGFDPPLVIAKDKSQQVAVTFTAIDGQKHASSLVIHSNGGKPQTVNLVANQNIPCLKVIPDKKVNFGFVTIGEVAKRPVVLKSCGQAEVEISGLAVIDDTGGVFTSDTQGIAQLGGKPVAAANPILLQANQEVTVLLACEPPSESKLKPFTANLKLTDNTVQPDKIVAIECYGSASSCPTAVIQTDEGEQIVPQQELNLTGSQSFASPGKQVTKYKWEVTKKPAGAEGLQFYPNDTVADPQFGVKTDPKPGQGDKPSFPVNVAGEYEFKLTVTDNASVESCQAAFFTVLVIPDEAIHVELLWDTPGDLNKTDSGLSNGSDLDLHFTHPNAEVGKICQSPPEKCGDKPCACQYDVDADGKPDPFFHGLYDCNWYNPSPNWANFNPAIDDNPGLDLDDTDGWGPENLNLKTPENDAIYTVGVHYWDAHEFGDSKAFVNIYLLGTLKAKYERNMAECDMWWVKKIEWPSGALLDVAGAVPDTTSKATGKISKKYKSVLAATLGGVCGK